MVSVEGLVYARKNIRKMKNEDYRVNGGLITIHRGVQIAHCKG